MPLVTEADDHKPPFCGMPDEIILADVYGDFLTVFPVGEGDYRVLCVGCCEDDEVECSVHLDEDDAKSLIVYLSAWLASNRKAMLACAAGEPFKVEVVAMVAPAPAASGGFPSRPGSGGDGPTWKGWLLAAVVFALIVLGAMAGDVLTWLGVW